VKRRLDTADLEAAIIGGLLLSAGGSGGSGIARNRAIGQMALSYSGVDLVDPASLDSDALVIVASGIGAPATSRPRTEPRHAVESARLLLRTTSQTVAAVMPAHVPGLNAWLQASVLGLALLDAATNGRGHPTVKMGGMGLASRPHLSITQAGVGGRRGEQSFSVVAKGDLISTSNIMRAAALENGGLLLATRGPMTVDDVRRFGAAGAISCQIDLGRSMLDAGTEGDRRIAAATSYLKGRILACGKVTANSVVNIGAFDTGWICIDGNDEIRLGVCNEYVCADRDTHRICTFPDLIATLDPSTGIGLEVSELKPGTDVTVIVAEKDNLPLGAGVMEASVYGEIERALGAELATYALKLGNQRSGEQRRTYHDQAPR
jgi:uncharacterized protein